MTIAVTPDTLSTNEFKSCCQVRERSPDPLIKAQGLAYVVLQRPDLDRAADFFTSFGLLTSHRTSQRILMRGRTSEHHILVLEKGPARYARMGLYAERESLDTLSTKLGLPVEKHDPELGGEYVTLTDPAGLTIEVNAGLRSLPDIEKPAANPWNLSDHKPRINRTVRKQVAPVQVHKLGHTVHSVSDIKGTIEWYQDTLGMIVSDFQLLNQEEIPSVAFMRCDRGDIPVDHHTIALGLTPELGHLHTAFELDSMEEIAIAQEWLQKQDYTHSWGIGRHILGSQIFDYWRDPDGDLFEHYADGDLFDSSVTTGYHPFHKDAQHQWGPHMSADFAGTNHPWRMLKSVVRRLFNKDDLNLARIKKLNKALN
jgi:catechol 2,3-dioxygenase-like lactoylglutathione lyase family enzyme